MKVLVIKPNRFLFNEKSIEAIRQDILRQIDNGGVIVIDQSSDVQVMEFDAVKVVDGVN